MILAGDFGGTNARLALFEPDGDRLTLRWRASHPSGESDWRELVARAVRDAGARLDAATIAVAGPVADGAAEMTNLGWRVSEDELAGVLGLARAGVVNDLAAAALGLPALAAADLAVLQEGAREAHGMRVLCSPGTGLGAAGLQHTEDGWRAIPSEGGHATLAPLDDEDRELALFLARRHGHVSAERVLSGAGLVALYEFQRDARGVPDDPALARAVRAGEGAPAVTRAALAGAPIAVRALERFVHVLGGHAANLALTFLARGGVYLGGGIPPRIRPFLERPAFLRAFLEKGRMGELLARVPVSLVLNSDLGLIGAARHAARAAGLSGER